MAKTIITIGLMMPTMVLANVPKASESSLSNSYMTNLVLSLGLVVGLIFALAWLVKRFNVIPQQNQGLIKIVSTISLSSRDKLALIQVGEEQLLISMSPGKISKLHSLATPIQVDDESQGSFKDKFNRVINDQLNKKEDKENNE